MPSWLSRWLDRAADRIQTPPGPSAYFTPGRAQFPPSAGDQRALADELEQHGVTRMVAAENRACLSCGQDDGNTTMAEVAPRVWEWRHREGCNVNYMALRVARGVRSVLLFLVVAAAAFLLAGLGSMFYWPIEPPPLNLPTPTTPTLAP